MQYTEVHEGQRMDVECLLTESIDAETLATLTAARIGEFVDDYGAGEFEGLGQQEREEIERIILDGSTLCETIMHATTGALNGHAPEHFASALSGVLSTLIDASIRELLGHGDSTAQQAELLHVVETIQLHPETVDDPQQNPKNQNEQEDGEQEDDVGDESWEKLVARLTGQNGGLGESGSADASIDNEKVRKGLERIVGIEDYKDALESLSTLYKTYETLLKVLWGNPDEEKPETAVYEILVALRERKHGKTILVSVDIRQELKAAHGRVWSGGSKQSPVGKKPRKYTTRNSKATECRAIVDHLERARFIIDYVDWKMGNSGGDDMIRLRAYEMYADFPEIHEAVGEIQSRSSFHRNTYGGTVFEAIRIWIDEETQRRKPEQPKDPGAQPEPRTTRDVSTLTS